MGLAGLGFVDGTSNSLDRRMTAEVKKHGEGNGSTGMTVEVN